MKTKTHWVLVVLISLWIGVPRTATGATSQSKAKPASAQGSRSYTIARNPYLGAIVVEASTGRVLFEDRADAKGYPASVLKLMDLLVIIEKIEQGQLSLQDQVPVSRKAALTGGSQVWLAEKESFTLDEMLYALMVRSANDVAVALAEKVSGSTEAFVGLMNAKAKALGMNNTVFSSVHGLPPSRGQQDDVTTARDLAILCREVAKHPQALRYTSTRQRVFRPNSSKHAVNMQSHNPLLREVEGCDGLKTGYIAKAGFSIAVSAVRDGRRILVVVLDTADRKVRDAKATELVAKGFAALSTTRAAPPNARPASKGASQ